MKNFDKNIILKYSIPMSIFGSGFIGIVLISIGFFYFPQRENIRIILSGFILLILLLVNTLSIFSSARIAYKAYGKKIFLPLLIPLTGAIILLIGFIKQNFSLEFFDIYAQFGTLCIFSAIVGLGISLLWRFEGLDKIFRLYSICLVPFSLFYVGRIFTTTILDPKILSVGGMAYMMIAYTLLPGFISATFSLSEKSLRTKKSLLIDSLICCIFWIAIVFSGTRGTIICVAFFIVSFLLMHVSKRIRKKYDIKPLIIILVLVSGTYIIFTHIWSPRSAGTNWRLQNFIYEEKVEPISKSGEGNQSKENLLPDNINNLQDYLFYSDKDADEATAILIKAIESNEPWIYKITDKSIRDTIIREKHIQLRRIDLYQLSYREIKKSPVTGNGIMYFNKKYGTYPHNFILEISVDFGLPVAILLMVFLIYIFVKVLAYIGKNREIDLIILMCIGFLPMHFVSLSLYANYVLEFSIVFGLGLLIRGELKNDKIFEDNL